MATKKPKEEVYYISEKLLKDWGDQTQKDFADKESDLDTYAETAANDKVCEVVVRRKFHIECDYKFVEVKDTK